MKEFKELEPVMHIDLTKWLCQNIIETSNV